MRKMTQADRDAGLTQADVDAGLSGGRNERISDEDRTSAKVKSEKADSTSIVDKYRDYSKNPEAKAFPVASPSKLAETSTPEEPKRRTSNDAIGDLVKKLGSGRVGTTPSSFSKPDLVGAKKGGYVKKMAKGGSVSSASKRADGCAVKGKTRGMMR
jgi:hypothetical protein